MLFNSFAFIFLFLPVSFVGYFLLGRLKEKQYSKLWLLLASLFFYAYWNPRYLPLLAGSVLFNFWIGRSLTMMAKRGGRRGNNHRRKWMLFLGCAVNILLLGYFKYMNFFISSANSMFGLDINVVNIILPLGISFFTFVQIAYIVDTYREKVRSYTLLDYSLFVTFFPHLIAGPIVHHKDVIKQFNKRNAGKVDYDNVSKGMMLFAIGLVKKVLIADTFAHWANVGYEATANLRFFESWMTSLSYSMQLYYDFSGYIDMAIGLALLFNIKFPQNFNLPYRSLSVREFWKRWNITLGKFLQDYIYIPLGGNRRGNLRTYINLIVTFLIGGIWHGAGWLFVLWGLLHGVALVIERAFSKTRTRIKPCILWILTFSFINITWVFFRAGTVEKARKVLEGMFGLNGVMIPSTKLFTLIPVLENLGFEKGSLAIGFEEIGKFLLLFVPLFVLSVVGFGGISSYDYVDKFKTRVIALLAFIVLFVLSVLNIDRVSEFLYFQF